MPCIFCTFIQQNQQLIYQDDLVAAFNDHKPSAQVHILVIPKAHISDIGQLTFNDISLVEHMTEVCNSLLQERGCNWITMFHHQCCISVRHLHLHGMILPFKGMLSKILFSKCVTCTPSQVIAKLYSKSTILPV